MFKEAASAVYQEDSNAQAFSKDESAQIIKTIKPKHAALSRLHADLKATAGTATITSYDRMHHRHNRS